MRVRLGVPVGQRDAHDVARSSRRVAPQAKRHRADGESRRRRRGARRPAASPRTRDRSFDARLLAVGDEPRRAVEDLRDRPQAVRLDLGSRRSPQPARRRHPPADTPRPRRRRRRRGTGAGACGARSSRRCSGTRSTMRTDGSHVVAGGGEPELLLRRSRGRAGGRLRARESAAPALRPRRASRCRGRSCRARPAPGCPSRERRARRAASPSIGKRRAREPAA